MMEDPTPPTPIPQKRPLEEDIEPPISTPVKSSRSETNSPLSVRSVQTPSPFKNNATPNMAATSSSATAPASSAAQPAKRRKLTQQEKDDQKSEKEAKAKARAEKKAQKEAEDKLKEEEKQKKAEEREEKRRQKEEEQQQKEEEKAKKERVSQSCINPRKGRFTDLSLVSDETERFLRQAESRWCQSWKGLGRVLPEPYIIINITTTRAIWDHY
jgi:hypothetical protein